MHFNVIMIEAGMSVHIKNNALSLSMLVKMCSLSLLSFIILKKMLLNAADVHVPMIDDNANVEHILIWNT